MSLDVTIKYKQPKKVDYNKTHAPCGSTMALVPDNHEEEREYWSGNITHNMGNMADHIPTSYHVDGEDYSNNLYSVVWRPEEFNIANTTIVGEALGNGIAYMVTHRKELEQYNPSNGWGDYDSFLQWLIAYKQQCDENPDCEIEVWR